MVLPLAAVSGREGGLNSSKIQFEFHIITDNNKKLTGVSNPRRNQAVKAQRDATFVTPNQVGRQ